MTIPGELLETVSLVVRDALRNWPWLLLWAASLLALVFWQRRRLHQAQVGFPDIVTLARPDTTLVECNEVCQRVLGTNPAGKGRCSTTGIEPILLNRRVSPSRCAPAFGQLTRGKVKDLSSPSFLKRGRPRRLPVLSGTRQAFQALSSRSKFCWRTSV